MLDIVKKYKEKDTGSRVVEVEDLSFLKDRDHPYGWFKRHSRHHRLRRALKKADRVIAADGIVAVDLVKYYFVSKEKIVVKD